MEGGGPLRSVQVLLVPNLGDSSNLPSQEFFVSKQIVERKILEYEENISIIIKPIANSIVWNGFIRKHNPIIYPSFAFRRWGKLISINW